MRIDSAKTRILPFLLLIASGSLAQEISSSGQLLEGNENPAPVLGHRAFEMTDAERERNAILQGNVGIENYVRRMGPPTTSEDLRSRFVFAMQGHIGTSETRFPKLYDTTNCDRLTAITRSLAMAVTANWEEYFAALVRLTFKNGDLRWEAKNTWLVVDWPRNNNWILENVSSNLGVPSEELLYRYDTGPVISQLQRNGVSGAEQVLGSGVQVCALTVVPRVHLRQAVSSLEDGDILFFVLDDGNGNLGDHLMSVVSLEGSEPLILAGGKRLTLRMFTLAHDLNGVVVLRLRKDINLLRQTVIQTQQTIPRVPTAAELDEIVLHPERRKGPWCNCSGSA